MIACRPSLAGILLAVILAAGSAAAQTSDSPSASGAPTRLGQPSAQPYDSDSPPADKDEPPVSDMPAKAPADSGTPPAVDSAAPPADTAGGAPVQSGPLAPPDGTAALSEPPPAEFKPGMYGKPGAEAVSSTDLTIVDGPPAGLIDGSDGGFEQGMWSDSARPDIEDLLGRVPLVSADPFARILSRRIVLTKSDAPIGTAKRTLIAIRVEKLMQAGMVEDAATLAASVSLDNDADYARVQADALLYAGRDNDICRLTPSRLTQGDTFWLELRLWCAASAGDTATAELTHGVMDAQGIRDPAFDVLANDVLTGKNTQAPVIDHPTALHIYLLRKAGLPVHADFAAKLGTIANALASRETRNTPAERLLAATRISQTGALAPAELRAILDAQTIPPDQIAKTQDVVTGLPFLPAQSLLRRAAGLESRLGVKTDLVTAALSADNHIDRLPLTAAIQSDLISGVKPEPALTGKRFLIARALLLRDKTDQAAAWYVGAPDDEDAHVFALLLDLAGPSPARDAAAQDSLAWFAHSAMPQQNPSPVAALALGLFDVLHQPMPDAARALASTLEGTSWDGRKPAPDDLRKLADAASQPARKGEALLRVLDIVGPTGPSGLPPDVTIECARTLQQLGLTKEARALAIEALASARP
jgi:hypothetical protein